MVNFCSCLSRKNPETEGALSSSVEYAIARSLTPRDIPISRLHRKAMLIVRQAAGGIADQVSDEEEFSGEEDEPEDHSLPDWVKLEYMVCQAIQHGVLTFLTHLLRT